MDFVRFRAEYGKIDYVATDVYKVELINQMEDDPAFGTLRIWYSDPNVNSEDFETLERAFIEEACTVPSYPDRSRFEVKLAKSYSDEDVTEGEVFQDIEYCRRHYPGGSGFELSLLGENVEHSFSEHGFEIEYSEIVELRVQ